MKNYVNQNCNSEIRNRNKDIDNYLKSELMIKMGDYKTVLDPDILLEFDHLGLTRFVI